jgi:hypothetical protein
MNMSDIRNTDSTQAFFWAIAIPVTAGIVFVAVFLACRGDKLYYTIVQTTQEVKERWRAKNLQTALSYDGGTSRHISAFSQSSWILRRQGKPKLTGVKLETPQSPTGRQPAV